MSNVAETVSSLQALNAFLNARRDITCRNVRKLDAMRYGKEKTALRAATAAFRTRSAEMWNAMALCQNKPVDGKPNHYTCRDAAECEAMAADLLARFSAE